MNNHYGSSTTKPDVTVIGGGAAGMLASCVAADSGARVLLLERNDRLGKKLSITGKGRCNLTNDCSETEFMDNVPTGGKFLHSSLDGFKPRDVMSLFESLGVPLKVERGARVFPQSDRASDIVRALERHICSSGVHTKRCRALELISANGRVTGVRTDGGAFHAPTLILATGGKSYPETGSTGDGYDMAGAVGHRVTQLSASLVPLVAEPGICAGMQGLTLKNVRLSVYDGGKKPVFEDIGEILFTHFGLSGPLTLSASAHMREFACKRYHALIDLKPALDEKKLDLRILRDFEKYSNRDFSNALNDLICRALVPVVIGRSGIPPGAKPHSISREQRLGLGRLLKAFRIDISGPRPIDEAIITSGGVDLREVNPKTMESKLAGGLYFAGEILDADAYTGGFNLQIAWSTAYAAARAAAQSALATRGKVH